MKANIRTLRVDFFVCGKQSYMLSRGYNLLPGVYEALLKKQ